jgi:hypothetical protein
MALQVCPKMFATKLVAKIYGRGKIKKQQSQKIFVSFRFKKKHKSRRFHRKKLGTKIAYFKYGYRKNKTVGANRYKQTKRRL